jgi:hypothetical protein
MSAKKVTEFIGRASGDTECFCFDRRTIAEQERDESLVREDGTRDYEAIAEREVAEERAGRGRVYPGALLPDGTSASADNAWTAPFGRWRITIEFEPE